MTILYVFPHPDDESFGPAPAIARQRREGHDVHLLTLTRGGATKQRHRLGLSIEEMGAVRTREMQAVAEALDLTGLHLLDLPDGGLADLDPRDIEAVVRGYVEELCPDVLVTYAVHGISGHPDHLVSHAVVKRAYCACRGTCGLARLALFTLAEEAEVENPDRERALRRTPLSEIGAVVRFTDEDRARAEAALACYATYAEVIEKHRPLEQVAAGVPFVLFGERHAEPLESLFDGL